MNNNNKLDVLSRISSEMAEVLRFQEENSKDAFNTVGLDYPEIRANYIEERRFWNEGGPVMKKTMDVHVPYDSDNGDTVHTRIYYPNETQNNACIFFIHGGGFVVGNVDTHDRIIRVLAEQSGCIVIGIDYSLSPEARYPRSILECVAVTNYYREHAAQYGIDPNRIGYAGDSGGASLSMATALWLRDHSDDTSYIKCLLLYYGMFGLNDSRSMRLYGGAWDGLTEEDMKFYMDMYIEKPEDIAEPYICMYNNDLYTRMPACFVASCEFDPLVDDDETLYLILKEKGVPCEYKMYNGTIHAFLHYTKMMDTANEALADGASYFKKFI